MNPPQEEEQQEHTEGSPREPLLPKRDDDGQTGTNADRRTTDEDNGQNNQDSNDNSDETPPSETPPSAALLGVLTLALVLVGLGLVVWVCFLPLWIWLLLLVSSLHHIQHTWMLLFSVLCVNVLHLWGLWTSPLYLSWQRTLVLPFRRLLFPLVPQIARIESIREQETTQYYTAHVSSSPSFRKSVRRHYRRMEKIYQRHHIRHVCVDAERQLCLQQVLPILWQHQQRATSRSMPMDEFIKRTLVVTVVPDGILDLYFTPQEELVAVQFSIWQAPHVWHWFMYFCDTSHSQAGIWWHGALLAMQRGHVLAQQNQHDVWVNAQVHQQDSKSHAGYAAASHTHLDMLSDLYPWTFTRQVPESVQQLRLWDSPAEAAASTEDAAASDTAAASSNSLIRLAG